MSGRLLLPLQAQELLHLLQLSLEPRPGDQDKRGAENCQWGRSQEKLHGEVRAGLCKTDYKPLAGQSLYTAVQISSDNERGWTWKQLQERFD